jgi:preprotein translocase subunit SecE
LLVIGLCVGLAIFFSILDFIFNGGIQFLLSHK